MTDTSSLTFRLSRCHSAVRTKIGESLFSNEKQCPYVGAQDGWQNEALIYHIIKNNPNSTLHCENISISIFARASSLSICFRRPTRRRDIHRDRSRSPHRLCSWKHILASAPRKFMQFHPQISNFIAFTTNLFTFILATALIATGRLSGCDTTFPS
jgi:hypothetical protein